MTDLEAEVTEKTGPVLQDHKRKNKRLIPPLLAVMGDKHSPYSWARQLVPELIWIGMLQQGMGIRKGVDFSLKIALEADKICSEDPKPIFAKMTSFGRLSESEKASLAAYASTLPDYQEAMRAIEPLYILLPQSPLDFLRMKGNVPDDAATKKTILELMPKLYDRHEREAVLTIATSIYICLRQGKLLMGKDHAQKISADFEAIERYPDTEESKAAGSSFRAMVPMLLLSGESNNDQHANEWLDLFWEQVGEFGECELPIEIHYEEEPEDEFGKIIVSFKNSARRELYERLRLWKFDLNQIELHDVVGALLARQVTLAVDLASIPPVWTSHSAPLFLRAMADVYITLAWIFESPGDRTIKFIEDGLGSVKLELAHRKKELETSEGDNSELKKMIEYLEKWLTSQRIIDLVEVNLGNWSGITTRKMAEEAGCIDFYNYVYQPFSSVVHSSWPHISDKNSTYCLNPTHRLHKLAVSVDFEPDPHWVVLAAKYLEKAYKLFDLKTKTASTLPSAYDELLKQLAPPKEDPQSETG